MTAEEFEASGLAAPTPDINTEASIPQDSLTVDVEVAEPQMASAPLREAPRVEEVIVTAPRPAAQPVINPLSGVIANYYRAIARRQAINARVAYEARLAAEQHSWNRFARAAEIAPVAVTGGYFAVVGGAAGATAIRGGWAALPNAKKLVIINAFRRGMSELVDLEASGGTGIPRLRYDPRRMPPAITRPK